MKTAILTALLLLLTTATVSADDFHVIISGTAKHVENDNYNERNRGLGFQYDLEERNNWIPFYTGARFLDSNENWSNYLGGGTKRRFLLGSDPDGLHVDLGVVGFLMTREGFRNGNPFPGVLPFASVGNNWFAVNATYVPKIEPKMVQFYYFQLMFKVAEF